MVLEQPILSSKTNLQSVWKEHFSVSCKFLSYEVETLFWKSVAKHLKLFKSKVGHKNFVRKWFWSSLELENECCKRFNKAFSRFLQVLSDENKTTFWESYAKHLKLFKSRFGHKNLFRKWFWSNLEPKNEYSKRFKIKFPVSCNFLSDESETIFWETYPKHSKLFKSKFGHNRLLRNGFGAGLS